MSDRVTLTTFYEKLEDIHKDITSIKIQTTRTNGRVTANEKENKRHCESIKNNTKNINKVYTKTAGIAGSLGIIVSIIIGLII